MRDIGPSDALRKWFHHEDAHWDEFVERYETELGGHPDELDHLRALEEEHGKVTLLYGARDAEHNQAVVLERTLARPAS
jgi:uncharacterized protein YeaO (DUF488 family)